MSRSKTVPAVGPLCPPLAFGALLFAAGPALAVTFTDVTADAGIDHVQAFAPAGGELYMTGGAAAGDYDGDGWTDLFVTRLGAPDILYRNRGDGTFEDVSAAAGFTAPLKTNGAAWGDIDNDGDLDLYVTAGDDYRFYLYANQGDGTFLEQGLQRNAAVANNQRRFGQGVAFGDYDRDGFLDILTSDWGNFAQLSTSRLLRNRAHAGVGTFSDVTVATGLNVHRTESSFRFSPRFTDLDADGHTDVVFASDFLTSQLFWNNGDNTFTDGTIPANVGTDENGMGSTVGDFDGDGRLDWFITAIKAVPGAVDPLQDTGNRLYRNLGDRTFEDVTDHAGVRDAGWGWGTTFFDYDHDGDLDLIATNGWGDDHINDPTTLWRNDGDGRFTDVSADMGITDTLLGRGLLTLDYDNDGDLDVFVVNHADEPILYRNDGGNDAAWLRIATLGTDSNRDGIGARITVIPDLDDPEQIMLREIDGGSNFLAHNEMTAHFGLGNRDTVDRIEILWPSGKLQVLTDVAANTELLVREPATIGDLNRDGQINLDDLDLFISALAGNRDERYFLDHHAYGNFFAADANGDGLVDNLDIAGFVEAVSTAMGTDAAALSSHVTVPEPTTLSTLAVLACPLMRRRR